MADIRPITWNFVDADGDKLSIGFGDGFACVRCIHKSVSLEVDFPREAEVSLLAILQHRADERKESR